MIRKENKKVTVESLFIAILLPRVCSKIYSLNVSGCNKAGYGGNHDPDEEVLVPD